MINLGNCDSRRLSILSLPGELICHTARFISPRELVSFYQVHSLVLKELEKHHFYEWKCRDHGIFLLGEDNGKMKPKEKLISFLKFEEEDQNDKISLKMFELYQSSGEASGLRILDSPVDFLKFKRGRKIVEFCSKGDSYPKIPHKSINVCLSQPKLTYSRDTNSFFPSVMREMRVRFKLFSSSSQGLENFELGVIHEHKEIDRWYSTYYTGKEVTFKPKDDFFIDSGDTVELVFNQNISKSSNFVVKVRNKKQRTWEIRKRKPKIIKVQAPQNFKKNEKLSLKERRELLKRSIKENKRRRLFGTCGCVSVWSVFFSFPPIDENRVEVTDSSIRWKKVNPSFRKKKLIGIKRFKPVKLE